MNRQVVPSLQSYRVKCHRAALSLQTFPLNLIHPLKALNLQALQAPVSLPLLNQAILPVAVLIRVLAVNQVKHHPIPRRYPLSLLQSQVHHRLLNQALAVNQVKHHPIPRRYPLSLLPSRVYHHLLNQVLAVNQVKHLLQNRVYHHLFNQAVLPVQVGLRVNPHLLSLLPSRVHHRLFNQAAFRVVSQVLLLAPVANQVANHLNRLLVSQLNPQLNPQLNHQLNHQLNILLIPHLKNRLQLMIW